MNGWTGKVLRLNLAKGTYTVEDLDLTHAKKFIGGRGLGVKTLFEEIDPIVEPLSADNKMIFTTSPLTGTGAPACEGCYVVTKGPLTGAIAMGRFGGEFGPALKFAGYDMLIVEGKAQSPVYISINDDDIEFRSAKDLWGKDTHETDELIRAEVKDTWDALNLHIACIGPAGENLVKVSSVMADKHHAAARSGIGSVMGSKNLKAIAVNGTKEITVADGEAFHQATLALLQRIKDSVILSDHLRTYGKLNVQYQANLRGKLAVRNFHDCAFEGIANTNARVLRAKYHRRNLACFACPVACVRSTEVTEPEFRGIGGGPEFQSCTMLGANCGVDNLAAILKANYLCNELGMDCISVGGTIACAMDMFENGYLTEEEVGCRLNFGNAQALVEMVEKMGRRQGFGNILAEGGYRLAEQYGHPEMFMGVKKQELPAWHTQVLQGGGLEFATANNGACHTKGGVFNNEVWGIPFKVDPFSTDGKAGLCVDAQHHAAARDTTGICSLLSLAKIDDTVPPLLAAATGVDYTLDDTYIIGERIWNLERLFNVKAGFTSKDDTLPKRIMEQPMSEGPGEGQVNRLYEMLPEYYRLRGWDEDGIPTPEKLVELDLP